MKNLLVLVLSFFAMVNASFSQSLDANGVPQKVKNSFSAKYPGISGKWEKEKNNYEVNFKNNGKTMSLLITGDGQIIETETDISQKELPAQIQPYIKSHYPGKSIKESARIEKPNEPLVFEVEVGGTDVLFDSNGKFLKEAKD